MGCIKSIFFSKQESLEKGEQEFLKKAKEKQMKQSRKNESACMFCDSVISCLPQVKR